MPVIPDKIQSSISDAQMSNSLRDIANTLHSILQALNNIGATLQRMEMKRK